MSTRMTGLRPYYRRTLRSGNVVVYFRGPHQTGRLVTTAEAAAKVPAGHSYTIEEFVSGKPGTVETRTARRPKALTVRPTTRQAGRSRPTRGKE